MATPAILKNPVKPLKTRTTRSISFPAELLAAATRRATSMRRTVNWYINDLVREDTQRNP